MNATEKGAKSVLCAGVKEKGNVAYASAREGKDALDAEELGLILGEIGVLVVMVLGMKNVSVAMEPVITDVRFVLAPEERPAIIVMEQVWSSATIATDTVKSE